MIVTSLYSLQNPLLFGVRSLHVSDVVITPPLQRPGGVTHERNVIRVNRLISPTLWPASMSDGQNEYIDRKTQVKTTKYRLAIKRMKGIDFQDCFQNSSTSCPIVSMKSSNAIANTYQYRAILRARGLTELNISDRCTDASGRTIGELEMARRRRTEILTTGNA